MNREKFREIKTEHWHTIEYLGMPADQVRFIYVEREIPEPGKAADIRREVWDYKLIERKTILEQANPDREYIIKFDDATQENALFERGEPDKKKMWAGQTVTLASYEVTDEKAHIKVHPISYTEWVACHDPRYALAFESENLPLPHAGIGVSTLIITKDGLIPLTRRGIETPVYPGMLYPPGGGPKVGETAPEAILMEILEETGLKASEHFNPADLYVMAFIADTHFAGSKHSRPEFVARLPTHLGYRDIEDVYYKRLNEKGTKETDVWGLEPVSANTQSLMQTIKLHGLEMCPPTEAALTYELYTSLERTTGSETAFEGLRKFTESLRRYKREEFRPPIKLLGD